MAKLFTSETDMKIQSGTMYMSSISGPVMACVPQRMWWKPWKWQVTIWCQRDDTVVAPGRFKYKAEPTETTKNLSFEGAIGIMKLCGVEHKDFTEK
jgi:hypothetical protein